MSHLISEWGRIFPHGRLIRSARHAANNCRPAASRPVSDRVAQGETLNASKFLLMYVLLQGHQRQKSVVFAHPNSDFARTATRISTMQTQLAAGACANRQEHTPLGTNRLRSRGQSCLAVNSDETFFLKHDLPKQDECIFCCLFIKS